MKVTEQQLAEMEGNGARVTRSRRNSSATTGQHGGLSINVPVDELEAAIGSVGENVDRVHDHLDAQDASIAKHDERLVQFISEIFERLKGHDGNSNERRDQVIAAINEIELEVELPDDHGQEIAAILKLVAENAAAVEQIARTVRERPQIDEWDLKVQRDQSVEGDYKPIESIRMKAVR